MAHRGKEIALGLTCCHCFRASPLRLCSGSLNALLFCMRLSTFYLHARFLRLLYKRELLFEQLRNVEGGCTDPKQCPEPYERMVIPESIRDRTERVHEPKSTQAYDPRNVQVTQTEPKAMTDRDPCIN